MATGQVISTVRRIPPLPSIRDIIKMYNLKALRQLSQNFLMDHNLNNKIVKCCGKIKGFEICEVGPGPGNLTRAILNKSVEKVILLEKDTRFLPTLQVSVSEGFIVTMMGAVNFRRFYIFLKLF